MSPARRALSLALLLFALLIAYLAGWPTPVSPRAWNPPPAPELTGVFASNGKLSGAKVLAQQLRAPEAIWPEPDGTLLAGTEDGQIVRIDPATGQHVTLARTGGRPAGLKRAPDGNLYIADSRRGLLRMNARNQIEPLVRTFRGQRLLLVDDVAPLPDGRVVFTDASTRFDFDNYRLDGLEHSSNGQVLIYDPPTRKTSLLLGGLDFPNGVAATREGDAVLVNETWAYRVRRIWVSKEKFGQTQIIRDNLPGFPDNLTYDPSRDVFWIALASPRDRALDAVMPHPFARKVIARLPQALQPGPKRHSLVVAIKPDGQIVQFLDDPRATSYSPTTHAVAVGPTTLYLGSFLHPGIAKVEL
jgi:sugar lactone lactonase YvrE